MRIAEVLLLDYDVEIANTRRTLERIPEQDPQWRPHEKSMPIGRLAVHVARLPNFCTYILTKDGLDFAKEKSPDLAFESTARLLSDLESAAAEARAHLAGASDDDLRKQWKMIFSGHAVIDAPRMVVYRTAFMNHLIHHRAQLGVYLRLLNIPVPGTYGPSADEPIS